MFEDYVVAATLIDVDVAYPSTVIPEAVQVNAAARAVRPRQ